MSKWYVAERTGEPGGTKCKRCLKEKREEGKNPKKNFGVCAALSDIPETTADK
jgi:hypothetical protein